MAKKFVVLCEKKLVPLLVKHCVTTTEGKSILVETETPEKCQKEVDKIKPGYKLLFGNSYKEILEGKYFTL